MASPSPSSTSSTADVAELKLRDVDVLIGICIFWLLFFIHALRLKRGRMVKNKGGVLVKANDMLERHYTPFLFDIGTKQHRVRSYEGFLSGKCVPPPPSGSFQVAYSTARRYSMYSKVHLGALHKCVRFTLICGALAIMLSWWSRNCDYVSVQLNTDLFGYEGVSANMKAAHDVQKILLPLASFILALYINMKLGWFNSVISLTWRIQGKIGDIALILASCATPPEDAAVRAAKFRIYRYLNLVHYFCYQSLAVDYNDDTIDDLVQCGLVLPDERDILERSTAKRNTVMIWIGATFRELASAGRVHGEIVPRIMEVLRELRGCGSTLAKELTRVAPISYAQLMQLMIDGLMILTPPALSNSIASEQAEGMSVYLWPALGSMMLAMFYQGTMRLVTSLEYPLGSDLDDLRPDWLLMATDRSAWGLLTDELPQQLKLGGLVSNVAAPALQPLVAEK